MTWTRLGRSAAVATSAAACLLVALGWGVGYRQPHAVVVFGPGGRPAVVAVGGGTVAVAGTTLPIGSDRAVLWLTPTADEWADWAQQLPLAWDRGRQWHGFAAGTGSDLLDVPNGRFAVAAAPAWAVWPVTAVLPLRWAGRLARRRRRLARGRCQACGYDLRGSAAAGCPECGAGRA